MLRALASLIDKRKARESPIHTAALIARRFHRSDFAEVQFDIGESKARMNRRWKSWRKPERAAVSPPDRFAKSARRISCFVANDGTYIASTPVFYLIGRYEQVVLSLAIELCSLDINHEAKSISLAILAQRDLRYRSGDAERVVSFNWHMAPFTFCRRKHVIFSHELVSLW